MDVSWRIRDIMTARDISQVTLASALNMSQPFVNQIVNGKKKVSVDTLAKICDCLQVSLSDFFAPFDDKKASTCLGKLLDESIKLSDIELQALTSVARLFHTKHFEKSTNLQRNALPVAGKAAAGAPIFDQDNGEPLVRVPPKYLDSSRFFIVQAKGDSMTPKIQNGDYVVVQIDAPAEPGDIALCYLEGEGQDAYSLKQYYKSKNRIELRSLNSNFGPLIYSPDKVKSLSKVVHIIHNTE